MDTVRAGPVPDRAAVLTGRRQTGPDRTDQLGGPDFRARTDRAPARAGPRGPALITAEESRTRTVGAGRRRKRRRELHCRYRRRCTLAAIGRGGVGWGETVSHESVHVCFFSIFYCMQVMERLHEPTIFSAREMPLLADQIGRGVDRQIAP